MHRDKAVSFARRTLQKYPTGDWEMCICFLNMGRIERMCCSERVQLRFHRNCHPAITETTFSSLPLTSPGLLRCSLNPNTHFSYPLTTQSRITGHCIVGQIIGAVSPETARFTFRKVRCTYIPACSPSPFMYSA